MATQTHSPFETLARVIEHLDDDGRSVRRTEAAGSGGDGSLRATVDVSVGDPSGDCLEPTDAAVDGDLAVTFRAPAFPDPAETLTGSYPRVSAVPTDVWLDGSSVVVTLEVTIGDADAPIDAVDAGEGDTAVDATADEEPERVATGRTPTATFGHTEGDDVGSDTADADEAGSKLDETDAEEVGAAPDAAGGVGAESEDTDAEAASPLAAVRDESVPPYDDTPYLRRLYETCETFGEMSERIEMDVSAETVRRYMIEADVHSPTSYETAGGTRASSGAATADPADGSEPTSENSAEAESATGTGAGRAETADRAGSAADGDPETATSLPDEQLVADGIGLPEELTLHDVVDVVVDARTVHEVQREVGLDYDRTRQLLTQLNVLDLVVGRVSDGSDRTVTVDVVADRIRQCTPDAA